MMERWLALGFSWVLFRKIVRRALLLCSNQITIPDPSCCKPCQVSSSAPCAWSASSAQSRPRLASAGGKQPWGRCQVFAALGPQRVEGSLHTGALSTQSSQEMLCPWCPPSCSWSSFLSIAPLCTDPGSHHTPADKAQTSQTEQEIIKVTASFSPVAAGSTVITKSKGNGDVGAREEHRVCSVLPLSPSRAAAMAQHSCAHILSLGPEQEVAQAWLRCQRCFVT